MKRIITYSIIVLLQASVAFAQTSVSLAQTPSKSKLQKREKYEWQGEIPVLDDADVWVNQLYEGQYVGDYLAKHGYVVLSIDAPMGENEAGRRAWIETNTISSPAI